MTRRQKLRPQQSAARHVSRRTLLQATLGCAASAISSNWFPAFAAETADKPRRPGACILLWMSGGPSQIDTFDPKPEHKNGGGRLSIETTVPGIQISENLPQVAKWMKRMAIVRSMSTKEGDHSRGTYVMRTGYRPQGPIQYPAIGALYSKELTNKDADLPGYVSISPFRGFNASAYGPGFLGPRYAPLVVGNGGIVRVNGQPTSSLKVENLNLPGTVDVARHDDRLSILSGLEDDFSGSRPGNAVDGHRTAYKNAIRMMRSESIAAFELDSEPDALKQKYGLTEFGMGCLLARRLVERGVPFIEVSLNNAAGNGGSFGWDTHQENLGRVASLCQVLDPAWATLMEDLDQRGLLDSTTIIWMGEFGRTPRINSNAGRDHFPAAWSSVLAGGGVKGGSIVGQTSPDGMKVVDRPVNAQDFLGTICGCLGIDSQAENISNVGRPISVVDPEAKPIQEVIA
ncbi:hypothetical protein CA54_59590 [Symmachiella macrocystis]|uniref:DUF1501 domain-containing protein n=1 Tax=Symmachiella macrocystis TaxID=2527985 RepID=A0A5C6B120_9PLAN|nr:DUF1501 domain-containing protein [Symmachiella macrocystis]TWU05271.1 hypothetical protein CA54_59590 [Symmachiella macrocystis]